MTELFDSYRSNYRDVVQSSIDFSGLPHSFFMRAKADLLRELIARRLGPEKPAMLDVGCGVGSFHPLLRGMVGRLSGIDVSSASIAQARADNRDVNYQVFDGRSFPFDDADFDLVTAICVLHHVAPAEWAHFMSEMRRVVRPGGLICVIEHSPLNPLTRLAVARCEFDRNTVLLGAGKARKLMAAGGLREIDTRYFLLLPWETKPARRVEGALSNLPLGAQYAAFGTA
jgi:SAM-dependent methyltransferase